MLALDYVDSINKIVAVGVNLLSPTHQNIVLFYKLVGAMLWNGYREKHKAKFLLQGPDSTVSAASTLEEHTATVSRVDKFRGKEDHGPAFMMLPKCKSGATTQINQPLRQMNTECGEMHYTVLSRSHK